MNEAQHVESSVWDQMLALWKKMENSRPADRSEQARRIAVAITEYQKVMAYWHTFVMEECSLEHYRG